MDNPFCKGGCIADGIINFSPSCLFTLLRALSVTLSRSSQSQQDTSLVFFIFIILGLVAPPPIGRGEGRPEPPFLLCHTPPFARVPNSQRQRKTRAKERPPPPLTRPPPP